MADAIATTPGAGFTCVAEYLRTTTSSLAQDSVTRGLARSSSSAAVGWSTGGLTSWSGHATPPLNAPTIRD